MPDEEGYFRSDFEVGVPTIHVKTGAFEADAIELYEMPHGKVLDLVTARGPQQMLVMLDLFKLAIVDRQKLDGLELLTFNEVTEAVSQWASKSSARWIEIGFGNGQELEE